MATPATIKQGSQGAIVKQWQQIIGVTADGKFGPNTTIATKKWQSSHGLKADGIVGPATWTAAQPVTVASKPVVQTVVKTTTTVTKPTLKQGSTGAAVVEWQKIINVTADGKFGPNTVSKTKEWQAARGLKADGIVGAQSWNAAAINAPIINKPTVFAPTSTLESVFAPVSKTEGNVPIPGADKKSLGPNYQSIPVQSTPVVKSKPTTPSPLGSFVPISTPVNNPPSTPTEGAQVSIPIPPQVTAVTPNKFVIPTWSKWVAAILALVGFGYGVKYTREHRSK